MNIPDTCMLILQDRWGGINGHTDTGILSVYVYVFWFKNCPEIEKHNISYPWPLLWRTSGHYWLLGQPKEKVQCLNSCNFKHKHYEYGNNSCIIRKLIFSAFICYLNRQNRSSEITDTRLSILHVFGVLVHIYARTVKPENTGRSRCYTN